MPARVTTHKGSPLWLDVLTSDPDRTIAFYGGLFGWTAVDAGEQFGHYINFSCNGELVAGAVRNEPGSATPNAWSVYLEVADAAGTAASAQAHGGAVAVPPMAVADLGTMLIVSDPGGAIVGGWQPGTHKGYAVHGEPGTPYWFELVTRAYEESLAFYRDVFAWDVHTMSDSGEFRYSTLGEGASAAAGVLDAGAFLPEGVPSHWMVYITVADTDAAVKKVGELGGSVIEQPTDTPFGRMAMVADSTGALFRVSQPPAG